MTCWFYYLFIYYLFIWLHIISINNDQKDFPRLCTLNICSNSSGYQLRAPTRVCQLAVTLKWRLTWALAWAIRLAHSFARWFWPCASRRTESRVGFDQSINIRSFYRIWHEQGWFTHKRRTNWSAYVWRGGSHWRSRINSQASFNQARWWKWWVGSSIVCSNVFRRNRQWANLTLVGALNANL